MKTSFLLFISISLMITVGCNQKKQSETASSTTEESTSAGIQPSVTDDESAKDIVEIAIDSKDHSTLVAALKQAELVTSLQNAGPFTVFAPTNAAFDKLPAGTVDDLMKDEKKAALQDILQYHVAVAVYKLENLRDGQVIGQANGDNITINIKDGKTTVNNTANVIASIPASNGIIHVIDAVLLPPAK